MQAYFWKHAIGRRWLIIPTSFLCGVLLHHRVFSEVEHHIGSGLLLFGAFFVLVYFKSYRQHMTIADDALNLHDSTDVTVTLADNTLTIARAQSQQQVEWSRVTKALETKEFLILFAKKIPVGNLPKEKFSAEQLKFIQKRIARGPTR